MRAVVVLPTPRTPVRIQACGMRPVSNALETVRTTASWPIRSAKPEGRYLRARTRYGLPPFSEPERPRPPGAALSVFGGRAPASVIDRSANETSFGRLAKRSERGPDIRSPFARFAQE